MHSVLVASTKGGCGKTTVATNLAAAFAAAGHATGLGDTDRQLSSLKWLERRPKKLPAITGYDWSEKLGKTGNGLDRLVIDAPAGIRKKRLEPLLKLADLVLIPVQPSVFDEDATRDFIDTIDSVKRVRKGKLPVGVVGNRVRNRTIATAQLEHYLYEQGGRVAARLRDSQVYPAAACYGLGLSDVGTRRARDVFEDWQPLLEYIDDCL